MAKKTKKEILETIGTIEGDLGISLLEDLTDSWTDDNTELETENENLRNELIDLKEKYKKRFLDGGNTEPLKIENKKKEVDEPREPRKFDDLFDEKGDLK